MPGTVYWGFEMAAAVGEGTADTADPAGDADTEGPAEAGTEGGATASDTQAGEAGGDVFGGGDFGGLGDLKACGASRRRRV